MLRPAIVPVLLLAAGLSHPRASAAPGEHSRASIAAPARQDLVLSNGGFEARADAGQPAASRDKGAAALPAAWGWGASPGSKAEGGLDSSVAHGGKYSFRLSNPEPAAGTFSWLTQNLRTLEPNTEYELSFWAKAEGNTGAWVAIEVTDPDRKAKRTIVPLSARSTSPEPTFGWRRLSCRFNTGEDVQWTLEICADAKVQSLWVDDFAVTRIAPPRAIAVRRPGTRASARRTGDRVHAKDFGAVGDRTADDTEAIQSALDSLGPGGGTVLLGTGRYLIRTIVVPENVGLLGDLMSPEEQVDMRTALPQDYSQVGSQLCLKPGCSVLMRRCSSLQNCLVMRAGLPLPAANDAECARLIAAFSGKGVIANETGILLRNCLILGFDTAISAAGLSGAAGGGARGRIVIDHCRIDANNGISVYTGADVIHIDFVHCWGFLTATVPGVTGPSLHRKGTGILIRKAEWLQVLNSFCYGYKTGFACEDGSAVSFLNCQADYGGPDEGAIGFAITGSSENVAMLGCTVITQRTGVLVEAGGRPGGLYNNVRIEGSNFANATSIDVRKGSLIAIGNTFNSSGIGIVTGPDADPAIVIGNCFDGCATPLSLAKGLLGKSTVLGNNYVRCVGTIGAIFSAPVVYPTYAAAEMPSASVAGAGATVFVSDAPGGAGLAVSDGTSWRMLADRGALPAVRSRQIVIGNRDSAPYFVTEGSWGAGKTSQDHSAVCLWAAKGDGSSKARFTPNIPEAGKYAVYIWYGDDPRNDHATDMPVVVKHAAGSRHSTVDLRRNAGKWNLLGEFQFAAGRSGFVEITNDASGNVVADAVRFERAPG